MRFSFFSGTSRKAGPLYYISVVIYAITILTGFYFGVSHYLLGWLAFAGAMYAVTANDSIQILGTLIESRKSISWFTKSIIFGSIFSFVVFTGWYLNRGSVSFERLDLFKTHITFSLLQLLVPAILILITGLKAPISTTFLILGVFSSRNIVEMLIKSFTGYLLAFIIALVIWLVLSRLDPEEYTSDKLIPESEEKRWIALKWISTSYLWIAWLIQDMANIVIYLPRNINQMELIFLITVGFIAISLIFISHGAPLQSLVAEKKDTSKVKASVIVDIVYGTILYFFQTLNDIPLSTTWVFLGLLAGREIILNIMTGKDSYLETLMKVGRDVVLALFGIVISIFVTYLSGLEISP